MELSDIQWSSSEASIITVIDDDVALVERESRHYRVGLLTDTDLFLLERLPGPDGAKVITVNRSITELGWMKRYLENIMHQVVDNHKPGERCLFDPCI
jgi:hypothetical protein